MGRPPKNQNDKHIWFTVWNAATDEVVAFGWNTDCAKMLETTTAVFASLVSYVKNGRNKKYVILREDLLDGSCTLYGASNTGVRPLSIDWSGVLELYEEGWWDQEIARRTGMRPDSIRSWRRRMGLPRNSKAEKNREVLVT